MLIKGAGGGRIYETDGQNALHSISCQIPPLFFCAMQTIGRRKWLAPPADFLKKLIHLNRITKMSRSHSAFELVESLGNADRFDTDSALAGCDVDYGNIKRHRD